MQKPLRACKNLYAQSAYPTEVLKLPHEIISDPVFQEFRHRPFIKYSKPQKNRTSPGNAKTSARLQKPLRAGRLPHRGSETTHGHSFNSNFKNPDRDHSSNTLNAEKQKTCAQKPKLLHACRNLYVCSGFPYRGDWNYHMVFFSSSFQKLDQNFFKCEKARAWRKPFLFKNVSNFLPSS